MEIFIKAPLSYLLISIKAIELGKVLLLTRQILGLLVNTLAADENYPILSRDNLTIPIQMQLSQKKKAFSRFFAAFLKSTLIFKYFEKKDDPHRFCISDIRDSKAVLI